MKQDRKEAENFLLPQVEKLGKELSLKAHLDFDIGELKRFVAYTVSMLKETRALTARVINSQKIRFSNPQEMEILLDNYNYIINEAVDDISRSLNSKGLKRLPQQIIPGGRKAPRMYSLLRSFFKKTEFFTGRDLLAAFFVSYQKKTPLGLRELEITPLFIRIVLMEEFCVIIRELAKSGEESVKADFWFSRIESAVENKKIGGLKREIELFASEYSYVPFENHLRR